MIGWARTRFMHLVLFLLVVDLRLLIGKLDLVEAINLSSDTEPSTTLSSAELDTSLEPDINPREFPIGNSEV
jgi:hypothetical protein